MAAQVLRIGTLGAARITPSALIRPARAVEGVEVVAVAARDPERAKAFAAKRGIPKVHATYDDLLADPDIDAVYNPLPNGLHAEWTIKALEAGKHVLCEKPFTANAEEAAAVARIADAAAAGGIVCMEAFHWRYHPMAARMLDLIGGGALGEVRHVETTMCIPLPLRNDIRYRYDLAGGAMMDVGAYATHMLRTLAGAEPTVLTAQARLARPDVDRWMRATVRFDALPGVTGAMTCALWSSTPIKIQAKVIGTEGELSVFNPVAPQAYHRLRVRSTRDTGGAWRKEKVRGEATYTCQMRAFLAAARDGAPSLTPPSDSVATMTVIDAVYRAAGLRLRGL